MGRRQYLVSCICPLLVAVILATASEAREPDFFGTVVLAIPRGWIPAEVEGFERTASGPRVVAAWTHPDGNASLNVAVQEGHVDVHPGRLALGGVELRGRLAREGASMGDSRVLDLRFTEVGREPAYRVESSCSVAGVRLRQIQYLVSGPDTYVLTFTAEESALKEVVTSVDDVLRSVRFQRRAGLLDEMPAWLCGGVLGVAAGAAAASRRRRDTGLQKPSAGTTTSESLSSKRRGTKLANSPSALSVSRPR